MKVIPGRQDIYRNGLSLPEMLKRICAERNRYNLNKPRRLLFYGGKENKSLLMGRFSYGMLP